MAINVQEIGDTITESFLKADLGEYFCYGDKTNTKVNVEFDKYGRLNILSLPMPYKVEDIADISYKNYDVCNSTKKDNCNNVRILFEDGVVLKFSLRGLEAEIDDQKYHGNIAVVYRMNYIYRTDVVGINVNPLIIKDRVVLAYCGHANRVVIPEGVTRISQYAFEESTVKRVVFPLSLRHIDDYSFINCKELSGMIYADQEEYVGDDMFNDLNKSRVIVVPNKIRVNISKAFEGVPAKVQIK